MGVLLFPVAAAIAASSGSECYFFGGFLTLVGVIGVLRSFRICPRCRKVLCVSRTTLVSPTYGSSGTGRATVSCRCGYGSSWTYSISRRRHGSHSSGFSHRSGGGSGRRW